MVTYRWCTIGIIDWRIASDIVMLSLDLTESAYTLLLKELLITSVTYDNSSLHAVCSVTPEFTEVVSSGILGTRL